MTSTEASNFLYLMKAKTIDIAELEALDMAIKALEQNESAEEWYKLFVEKLDEQEPCDDTVSIRKDVLKCRVGGLVVYNVEWLKKHWQMEMEIVCGVKPCEDAISREAVINIVKLRWDYYKNCIEAIEKLPSVTQKPGKCKTCKYWQDNNNGYPSDMCKWRTDETPDADDYCSEYEPQESEG